MKYEQVICASLLSQGVSSAESEWQPVTGAAELRQFVSGLRAERELPNGSITTGEYNADGTGVVRSFGASYPRTWQVKGEDLFCITVDRRSDCYRLERNATREDLYRAQHATTGEYAEFTVIGKQARIAADAPGPDNRGGPAAASAEEIAAELSNPNSVLGTLNTNFDYTTYAGTAPGAGDQSSMVIGFQPNLPYPLGEGKNFFLRPLVPLIVSRPVPGTTAAGFEDVEYELGDIGFDAAFGRTFKTSSGSNILLAGLAGSIPTATDDRVGSDQWTLGPELGGFVVRQWGVAGVIASHQRDIAGEDSFNTRVTAGQYIYAFGVGNGWQIIGSPAWSYNHEASSDDALTLPLGIGVARTMIIGGRPWKFSVQYWNYIEAPDSFGPEHQIRFTVGPVVDLPWGGLK